MDVLKQETDSEKSSSSNVLRNTISLIAVVAIFVWVIPRIASYSEIWQQLRSLDSGYIPLLIVLGIINLTSPAGMQCACLPGLRFKKALSVDWVTTAVTNTIPGGSAIAMGMTWSMYRKQNLSKGSITRSFVVSGVFDNAFKFATPLVAALWLATERPMTAGLVQTTIIGSVMFVVLILAGGLVVGSSSMADFIGELAKKLPFISGDLSSKIKDIQKDTRSLLAKRWPRLTLWTLVGHINMYLLLLFSLRSVGVESSVLTSAAILAAFAFGRLVTVLPITPGGVGVMELGLVATLAAVGDAEESLVVAGIFLFRFITFLIPIVLGAIANLFMNFSDDLDVIN